MDGDRNEYALAVTINGRRLRRVIIDQHYRGKHGAVVNDDLILELVAELNGQTFPVQAQRGDFQYFAVEPIYRERSPYRLVLVICITDDYLGVINAFRVKRR